MPHGEISWVSVCLGGFFLQTILGWRRPPKDVKFSTKVASSTGMVHTVGFSEQLLIVARFAKIAENAKNMVK